MRPSVATWRPATDEYEYQPLRIDARVSRSAAATMLAIRAEFSGWELARVLRFPDGSRRVWLRRRRPGHPGIDAQRLVLVLVGGRAPARYRRPTPM